MLLISRVTEQGARKGGRGEQQKRGARKGGRGERLEKRGGEKAMRVSKDPLYLWRHDRKRKKEIGKINDIEGGEEKRKREKENRDMEGHTTKTPSDI